MVCIEWSVLKGVLFLSSPMTLSIKKKKKTPMISCFNLLHFPSYHFLGYRDVLVDIELWFSFSLFLFLNRVLFDFGKSLCFFNALRICFKYSEVEDFVGMSVMHLQPSLSPPEQILPHTDVLFFQTTIFMPPFKLSFMSSAGIMVTVSYMLCLYFRDGMPG